MICMVLSALLLRGLLLHWSCLGRYFFSFTKIRTKNYLLENDAIVNQRLLQLQSKNALLSTFLFLDQFVWLGRTGIYKVVKIDTGFSSCVCVCVFFFIFGLVLIYKIV